MYAGPAFDINAFDPGAFDTSFAVAVQHGRGFGGGFGYGGHGKRPATDEADAEELRLSIMDAMGIPRPKKPGPRASPPASAFRPRQLPSQHASKLEASLHGAYRSGQPLPISRGDLASVVRNAMEAPTKPSSNLAGVLGLTYGGTAKPSSHPLAAILHRTYRYGEPQ